MNKRKPFISIIIPTLNEEGYIENCLKSIKRQSYKNYEIIVTDAKSKDKTVKKAKKYADKVIVCKRAHIGYQCNQAAKKAKGEIIVVCGADSILDENFLEIVVNGFKDQNIVGLSFIPYPSDSNNIFHKILFKISHILLFLATILNFPTSTVAPTYRKDVFEKVGGYDEHIIPCEDHALASEIKHYGKIKVMYFPVFTSCRRLKKAGILRTLVEYSIGTLHFLNGKSYHKFNNYR